MSDAWEVSFQDVANILHGHGIKKSATKIASIVSCLDTDEIEDVVLDYTDMDDQTNASYSEIEDRLMEMGEIPKENEKKFFRPVS